MADFNPELKKVAETLVEYCRTGQEYKGLEELYAANAESYEAIAMEGGPREFHGRDAIKGKHDFWNSMFESQNPEVLGPYYHGEDRFSVIFKGDMKNKQTGEVTPLDEVAVYTVDGGKITREEFYYTVG